MKLRLVQEAEEIQNSVEALQEVAHNLEVALQEVIQILEVPKEEEEDKY